MIGSFVGFQSNALCELLLVLELDVNQLGYGTVFLQVVTPAAGHPIR